MTPDTTVTVVESLVALAVFVIVLYGPWQQLMIDIARQTIFELRDEIFLKALNNPDITFSDESYRTIRSAMNDMIRHCHEMHWGTLLWGVLRSRSGESRHNPIEQALERIENDNLRKAIGHRLDLASKAVLLMVLLRSPLLMMLSMLFVVPFLLGWYLGGQIIATKVRRYLHKLKRNVQVEAIESRVFQA